MTSTFAGLGLPSDLGDVIAGAGITTPTPIQAATMPDALGGRDVLGRGRTGSGKTLAFCLPLVARLAASGTRRTPKRPRALILAPTRELVAQIEQAIAPLAKARGLSTTTVFGGVGQGRQVEALRRGVDVLLACPGRLEDLIGQGHVSLGSVEITVLDEADHMADLGFLPAVKRLLDATPRGGQRMLFSATLDAGVDVLVKRYLSDPAVHQADSAQSPVAAMDHHVLHVPHEQRFAVLTDLASAPGRTVVFTRTKHGAKNLAKKLNSAGVPTVDLHGNLAQNARTRNMAAFHSREATTLVATDIAARGIHVDDVALVVHADPPAEHKAYLHRSGRTARAGAAGTVVTLMTDSQVGDVRQLTRAAGIKPTTTKIPGVGHAVLQQLAPGERVRSGGLVVEKPAQSSGRSGGSGGSGGAGGSGGGSRRRRRPAGGSAGNGGQSRSGQSRSGQSRSGQSRSAGQGGGTAKSGGPRRRSGGNAASGTRSGGSHSAASFSSGGRRRG